MICWVRLQSLISILLLFLLEAHPERVTFRLGVNTLTSLENGIGLACVVDGLAAIEGVGHRELVPTSGRVRECLEVYCFMGVALQLI